MLPCVRTLVSETLDARIAGCGISEKMSLYTRVLITFLAVSICSISYWAMMLLETVGILLCSFSQVTRAVSLRNAEDGFTALQQFYNESIGLWIPSTGWWNSANCELLTSNYWC